MLPFLAHSYYGSQRNGPAARANDMAWAEIPVQKRQVDDVQGVLTRYKESPSTSGNISRYLADAAIYDMEMRRDGETLSKVDSQSWSRASLHVPIGNADWYVHQKVQLYLLGQFRSPQKSILQ